jgi:hypothetical protein
MIGGVAVADSKIGANRIKDDAVRARHIQDGAVHQRELSPGVLSRLNKPDAQVPTQGHLLFVENGASQMNHLSYALDEPVALNEITELSFFQELVHGDGGFGANVILGVDSDDDGAYEADDLGWHLSPTTHDPAVLGDDTFVEMDAINPSNTMVDAPGVTQWWSPNVAGTGFPTGGAECYNTLKTLVTDCADVRFGGTDKVHVIRFVLGGSSSWNDIAVRVTAPFTQGVTTTGLSTAS